MVSFDEQCIPGFELCQKSCQCFVVFCQCLWQFCQWWKPDALARERRDGWSNGVLPC
jgi:hypothetical protein